MRLGTNAVDDDERHSEDEEEDDDDSWEDDTDEDLDDYDYDDLPINYDVSPEYVEAEITRIRSIIDTLKREHLALLQVSK